MSKTIRQALAPHLHEIKAGHVDKIVEAITQAMLDALGGLYEPSINDQMLNEYQGKDRPVIYKSHMESAIKLIGGEK